MYVLVFITFKSQQNSIRRPLCVFDIYDINTELSISNGGVKSRKSSEVMAH